MPTLLPAGFFVLRTPALPWRSIVEWSDGITAAHAHTTGGDVTAALREDETLLRGRLRALARRADVRDAIRVASPSLAARLKSWLDGDESEVARGVEPALVRYVARMAGRATPFGLFAGVTTGQVDARTDLSVPGSDAHVRCTRINLDVLYALADHLANQPAFRAGLRYLPNDTVYEAGGRLRYYSVRVKATLRSYHLSEVCPNPALNVAFDAARAATGATVAEIATALARNLEGVGLDDALNYVHGLVAAQLIRPTIYPASTGDEPVRRMIDALESTPGAGEVAKVLRALERDLRRSDAEGSGIDAERSATLGSALKAFCPDLDSNRLLKVNLRKVGTLPRLGQDVVREVAAGVEMLTRMANPERPAVDRFVREFEERYQGREVPLLDVLDSECGIGFDPSPAGADVAPLLEGLDFENGETKGSRLAWGARERLLFERLTAALQRGATEIVLDDAAIASLSCDEAPPLPAGLTVIAEVAAKSDDALRRGDYRIAIKEWRGPSIGTLLGRFLQDDTELEAQVRKALVVEDAQDPEAIHAEIAHLPAAHTSNVLSRPRLRDHEIVIVGGSGAPLTGQIPLTDLLVSVRGGAVQLRSRSLGRRVVPHLSSAHNFDLKGLHPAYRFLASIQTRGRLAGAGWTWGPALSGAPFLPRVSYKKLVLSPARWNVSSERLNAIEGLRGKERFVAVQSLRAELKLPRHVRVVEADNSLPVDLENAMSLESFLTAPRREPFVALDETFPSDEELVARGRDGAYHHELMIPLVRTQRATDGAAKLGIVKAIAARPDLAHWPGDEWLFAKIHGGVAGLDRILTEVVGPLVSELRAEGAIDRWFFIRYGDPRWHLRLRIHGAPDLLWRAVAPRLFAAASRARGLVQKVVVDTYDPEIERYGGEDAMVLGERVFEADSDAMVDIVQRYRADAAARWRIALLGMDSLLESLSFSTEEKCAIAERAREGQARKFANGTKLSRQLGDKFRGLRSEMEALLADPPEALRTGTIALQRRAVAIARVAQPLAELERSGSLTVPRADVATSYLHMWANRALRGSANQQEVVLYDFLHRTYGSRLARARQGSRARASR